MTEPIIQFKGNLICTRKTTHAHLVMFNDTATTQFRKSYRFNPKKKWKECIEKVYYLNDR